MKGEVMPIYFLKLRVTVWVFLGHAILFLMLTILTQTGGVIWFAALIVKHLIPVRFRFRFSQLAFFGILYSMSTLWLIPPLAKVLGREQLPIWSNAHVKPESFLFWYLNRTYVRPELKKVVEEVAVQMQDQYPGAVIYYLDACFPFFDGFPLLPHLSHRDGKKIDLVFFWNDQKTGKSVQGTPSPYGYGVCAKAGQGEYSYIKECLGQGYWYFSPDNRFGELFYDPARYTFDEEKNREMVIRFARHPDVGKIFIEPHLKTRLSLEKEDKLRKQGCRAARHDDHIHVQM
ncbi:MAG: hypothetical protein IT270_06815 [Saprospiraceae bacterium]|nr:hypothetical protein [Saprospiraceae bacterium]